MKKLLLALCVVGSGIFVTGQAPSGVQRITAQRIEQISPTFVRFTGGVEIVTPSATITADEADVRTSTPAGPTELDLRRNVHVTVNANK